MTALDCPFCGLRSNFSQIWTQNSLPAWALTHNVKGTRQSILSCDNEACHMTVTAIFFEEHLLESWPLTVSGRNFPDVPPDIGDAASEAHKCMSIGAHRGAVALARAVVEATAKDNEADKGNLMEKIDALAKAGVISDAMKDAAHEIRFAGNEVAHGDLAADPLTEEDATEVLGLMDAILLRVYQEPAQVARVRERREARKQA